MVFGFPGSTNSQKFLNKFRESSKSSRKSKIHSTNQSNQPWKKSVEKIIVTLDSQPTSFSKKTSWSKQAIFQVKKNCENSWENSRRFQKKWEITLSWNQRKVRCIQIIRRGLRVREVLTENTRDTTRVVEAVGRAARNIRVVRDATDIIAIEAIPAVILARTRGRDLILHADAFILARHRPAGAHWEEDAIMEPGRIHTARTAWESLAWTPRQPKASWLAFSRNTGSWKRWP
jgi:hypothetical protein